MRTALRWAGYVVGGLFLLLLIAAAYIWFASSQKLNAHVTPRPERLAAASPAELADGRRQLDVHGCVSCHGEGLRGKLFFDIPNVATLHAPNLTLVAAGANDEQLARAIRQGIGHDGRSLLVMPSAQYSRLTDGEVAALVHAIRELPRGGNQTPPVRVGPLGRIGVATGTLKLEPEVVADFARSVPADLGPQHARGRHLAMTDCAECHGPSFGGGEPEPGVKAPDLSIAGAYDLPQFTRLLRTGVPASDRKLKLMDEVARNDFRHLKDDEIAAIHAYLVELAQRTP